MSSVKSAVAVAPLDDLRAVADRPGPFVSVYMTMEVPAEDARTRTELRWRELRSRLAEAGAPDPAVEAVAEALHDADPRSSAFGAIANQDGVLHTATHLAALRGPDVAQFGPLPSLVPMIEWRQVTPAHVAVVIDRTGADITVVGPATTATVEVEGEHDVINKPAQGGWSHRRVAQRAEDSWERNAEQVAETVARFAAAAHARLVVAAGDPRALALFEGASPGEVRRILRVVSGSRQDDTHVEEHEEEILHLVATAAAEDTVTLLERLRQETSRHGGGAEGIEATAAALRQSQVDVLAVHDDRDDRRRVWIGPSPEHVAVDAQTLRDLGVDEPRQGRVADAFVRAALGTGAGIRVIPAHGGPTDGVGALLRWET